MGESPRLGPCVGITLPTFVSSPDPALDAARVADSGGLDGVFAFDHLWPIGRPERPALWSFAILGAVAAITRRVSLGPFVARVGLLPDDDLIDAFSALEAVAGHGRVIAAIGAGDLLSARENLAYGVPYPSAETRLAAVGHMAGRLASLGIPTWVGGNSEAAGAVACEWGVARNLWAATAAEVAEAGSGTGNVPPVTWGGQVLVGRDDREVAALRAQYGDRAGLVSGTVAEVAAHLRMLGRAGASWCVCAPLDYLAHPEQATETLCQVAEAVK
jgi:alkanesulfonate monooxygenase SsuD/methylene tetrahydromethanopterin reductase-like flavin-dependent oxidoreductase (luciferase family)